jgi:hypothetical protein
MILRDKILITILACQDAVFLPHRKVSNFALNTVIYERRRDYRAGGLMWKSARITNNAKQAERTLQKLRNDGLVQIKTGKAKAMGVKLTPAGDTLTRRLCGLPTLGDSLSLLAALSSTWTPETAFTGGLTWGDDRIEDALCEVSEKMLPLLTSGLIESNSTIHGHVFYRLVAAPPAAMPEDSRDAAEIEGAAMLYYETAGLEKRSLATAKPVQPNELGIFGLSTCPNHDED